MLDFVTLATTATPPATVPGLGVPYPWGASAADEAAVFALWDLGRRWLAAHYDGERRDMVDALQPD